MDYLIVATVSLVIGLGIGTAFGRKGLDELHAKFDTLLAEVRAKL